MNYVASNHAELLTQIKAAKPGDSYTLVPGGDWSFAKPVSLPAVRGLEIRGHPDVVLRSKGVADRAFNVPEGANDLLLNRLRIDMASIGWGMVIKGLRNRVSNCEITNCGRDGIKLYSADPVVNNCIIAGVALEAPVGGTVNYDGVKVEPPGAYGAQIIDTVITGVRYGSAVDLAVFANARATLTRTSASNCYYGYTLKSGCTNVRFSRCLAQNCVTWGWQLRDTSEGVVCQNCLGLGSGTDFGFERTSGWVLDSCIWNTRKFVECSETDGQFIRCTEIKP